MTEGGRAGVKTAMSSDGSAVFSDALETVPSAKVTLMEDPPFTTCSAVRMSPPVSMTIPVPKSSLREAPLCNDSTSTIPYSTERYTDSATLDFDCSWEIALPTFRVTMPLTSFALTAGRPEMRKFVTISPAMTASANKRATTPPPWDRPNDHTRRQIAARVDDASNSSPAVSRSSDRALSSLTAFTVHPGYRLRHLARDARSSSTGSSPRPQDEPWEVASWRIWFRGECGPGT